MALKAIHASDVPKPHHVPQNATFHSPTGFITGDVEGDQEEKRYKLGRFMVAGHRGSGMNILQSSDRRFKSYKENSIKSFNHAAQLNLDFIEFDVQVTKDDCPVIFHDIHILTKDKGAYIEKRVTEITLLEFLSYGPQTEPGKMGKPLFRKAKDGSIFEWKVENDDPLCTLEEVFQKVDKSLGFNIELKFDDNKTYEKVQLKHILEVVLKVVNKHADQGRVIIFSSFQPDVVQLLRKLQDTFPVFFLTNGGCEIYADPRRNSLEEAIKLCQEARLDGIVSQVKAIFRNPAMVPKIRESKLSLMTYGQLNNVPEAVYMQHLMGVEGVIVDFVQEIREAVSDFTKPVDEETEDATSSLEDGKGKEAKRKKLQVQFSDRELAFLLKLMPELIQT